MIRIRASVNGLLVRGGTRLLNEVLKAAWLKAGELWHQAFRPKHFTHKGAREYGYLWRAGETLPRGTKGWRRKYTGRKYMKWGHTLPLVWSGESKARSAIRRILPTKHGVTIKLRTPTLNRRHKDSPILMSKEMRTISPAEKRRIVQELDKHIHRGLRRLAQRRRWTIEIR